MIVFSQQHRIVNDLALSFQKNQKIHTKISEKALNRDVVFLKPKKYESYTESNFKFIALWTIFKNNTTLIDTLNLLNSYSKEDIKDLMRMKEKIILYRNTLKSDFMIMSTKIKNTKNIFEMYRLGDISILYVFWYFNSREEKLSRIEERRIKRINFFMSFFPKIEEELKKELSSKH